MRTPRALLTRSSRPSKSFADFSDAREKPRRSQKRTETSASRGARAFERFQHGGREELAEARLLPLELFEFAQGAESATDHLGEFQVVADLCAIGGRSGGAGAVEAPGDVDRPAAARLAGDRCAEGPVEVLADGKRLRRGASIGFPDVQDALAAFERRANQSGARLKGLAGGLATVPIKCVRGGDGPVRSRLVNRDECGGARAGDAAEEHVHKSGEELVIVGGALNELGQPTEDVDAMVRVAKAQLLEVLRREGLLLDGDRRSEAGGLWFVEEAESRAADDEVFAGTEFKGPFFVAAEIDRIAGGGERAHEDAVVRAGELDMTARNAVVPRDAPGAGGATDDYSGAIGERLPPTLVVFGALNEEAGHGDARGEARDKQKYSRRRARKSQVLR